MVLNSLLEKAEQALKITFKDKNLLLTALTHRSFAFESKEKHNFNERLEFLGDSVLNLSITKYTYNKFPHYDEGKLSKLRAAVVNTETISNLASKVNLQDFIRVGKGAELTRIRENTSVITGCFEAIIGAIYLDQGFEAVETFILKHFSEALEKFSEEKELFDYKTALQEYTMANFGFIPEYKVLSQKGPAHKMVFRVEVSVGEEGKTQGVAGSKKKAEQLAAKELLKKLKSCK